MPVSVSVSNVSERVPERSPEKASTIWSRLQVNSSSPSGDDAGSCATTPEAIPTKTAAPNTHDRGPTRAIRDQERVPLRPTVSTD